ncbi:MAG: hypothetical protein QM689_07535 [Oscillospiraceae bacterium]
MRVPRKPTTLNEKLGIAALWFIGIHIVLSVLVFGAIVFGCWKLLTSCSEWQTNRHRQGVHIENEYLLPAAHETRTAGELTFTSCFTLKDGYVVEDAAGNTVVLEDVQATPSLSGIRCRLLVDTAGNLLDKQECDCGYTSDEFSIYTYSQIIFYTDDYALPLSLTDGTALKQNAAVCWRGDKDPVFAYDTASGAYLGEIAPFAFSLSGSRCGKHNRAQCV